MLKIIKNKANCLTSRETGIVLSAPLLKIQDNCLFRNDLVSSKVSQVKMKEKSCKRLYQKGIHNTF